VIDQPDVPIDDRDDGFGGLNVLMRSLDKLDDRGLVLSLAAFAEEILGALLKAFFVPSDAATQLLEGFNAPLGTFSARIKAAYALGLVTKDQFLDLERLRKVRNDFAHSWVPLSLEHPKLAAAVNAMSYSRLDERFPKTLSQKIKTSIGGLLVELGVAASQIARRGVQAKLIGNHLIPGFVGNDVQSQLDDARKHLALIEHQLQTTTGEEHRFHRLRLSEFENRLIVGARPKAANEINDYTVVVARIRALASRYET